MAIFCTGETKVLVQGITGRDGSFHSKSMIDYGTKVVAGVTPGRGGQMFNETVPVFDNVADAVAETGAEASVIFVPPFAAAGAIFEAADAGIKLIVCITEGVPTNDMVKVMPFLEDRGTAQALLFLGKPSLVFFQVILLLKEKLVWFPVAEL